MDDCMIMELMDELINAWNKIYIWNIHISYELNIKLHW